MPSKVLELHHHGIRIGTTDDKVEKARRFYTDVLGIPTDSGRPEIRSLPGYWLDVGAGERSAQIHLMGAVGMSPVAHNAKEDPTLPHVALAVEDTEEAKQWYNSLEFRTIVSLRLEAIDGGAVLCEGFDLASLELGSSFGVLSR